MEAKRKFVAYYYFVNWSCLSLGLHVCTSLPNVEIHLPFGFIRIGWVMTYGVTSIGADYCDKRTFGFKGF